MTRPGPHVATPSDVADVRTIRSGRAYRVDIDGDVYFFEMDHDDTGVFVRTRTHVVGGYFLNRFGNDLSPSSIRRFIAEHWRRHGIERADSASGADGSS